MAFLALHGININANRGLIATAAGISPPTAHALPIASVALVHGANIPPPPTHSFARIGRHVQRAHLFPQMEQTHPTKHVVIVHGADSLDILALQGININVNCGLTAPAAGISPPTAHALPIASVTTVVMENIPPLPMRIHV